jgi:hypothetical protein
VLAIRLASARQDQFSFKAGRIHRRGSRLRLDPRQERATTWRLHANARNPMTDREKIVIALREKPLKTFEIMKRVNIRNQEDCQSLLLKMRDEGAVKFDIHKGHWLAA